MGPLVPEIISNEFNLMIAFIIGIGFGYVLEQGGFSSTRKLAGLFYGYDFTVLRVFFTAGVTAMVGVLLLEHFNLLNMKMIYVNPTFLWSALIGGGIMGAGFIIGGFCPGTSVCAAAAGRLDAMFFLAGSFFGIFAFTEMYPLFKDIYVAENWGAVRIDVFLGLSKELFAVIMSVVAIGAFIGVRFIEDKVHGKKTVFDTKKFKTRFAMAAVPVVVILFTAFTPNTKEIIQSQVEDKLADINYDYKTMTVDNLISELLSNNNQYNLIDVRSKEEFKKTHIPLALNIPLADLENYEWQDYFKQKFKTNIFYSDNIDEAKKAYLLSEYIGESKKVILANSINEYFDLLETNEKTITKKEQVVSNWRIRSHNELIEKEKFLSKFSAPVKKKANIVKGGCS
jgi:rhodanese-related sulfurtransferase